MEAPQDCPPSIYALMTEAWLSEPKDRPSFAQILQRLQSLSKDTTDRGAAPSSYPAAACAADSDAYDCIFDEETI